MAGRDVSVLVTLVKYQRNRLVASVMGAVEEAGVSDEQKRVIREQLMGSVGVFGEFVIDAVKSCRDHSDYVNDEVLRVLSQVGGRRGR